MPLYWQIDSRQKLIVATAEDDVTRIEAETFLDVITAAQALSYRKLVDCTDGNAAMDEHDLLAIGVRARSMAAQPLGPLAIVLRSDSHEPLARLLGILAVAERPMRVFFHSNPARRWLDAQPIADHPSPIS